MYGSQKPNCEAYDVTKIYDYMNSKLKPLGLDKYNKRQLLDLYSVYVTKTKKIYV